jgi:hypothetical protein
MSISRLLLRRLGGEQENRKEGGHDKQLQSFEQQ